jgi:hypothetical protein
MKNKYSIQKQKIDNLLERWNTLKHDKSNMNTHKEINFCLTVISNTEVHFTDEGNELLSKGLQYNLHYKTKDSFKKLALEADTAVSIADPNEQNYLRYATAKKIICYSQE